MNYLAAPQLPKQGRSAKVHPNPIQLPQVRHGKPSNLQVRAVPLPFRLLLSARKHLQNERRREQPPSLRSTDGFERCNPPSCYKGSKTKQGEWNKNHREDDFKKIGDHAILDFLDSVKLVDKRITPCEKGSSGTRSPQTRKQEGALKRRGRAFCKATALPVLRGNDGK